MKRYKFPHYGTLTTKIGASVWFVTLLLVWARANRLPITDAWIGGGLLLGLLLVIGGMVAKSQSHHRPLSAAGVAHLFWLARSCPHAKALAEQSGTPTWGEAHHVAKLCRNARKEIGQAFREHRDAVH